MNTSTMTMDTTTSFEMLRQQNKLEWVTIRKEMDILTAFLRKQRYDGDDETNKEIKEMKDTIAKLETNHKIEIESLRFEIEKLKLETQLNKLEMQRNNIIQPTAAADSKPHHTATKSTNRGIKAFLNKRRNRPTNKKSTIEVGSSDEISKLKPTTTTSPSQNELEKLGELLLRPMLLAPISLTQNDLPATSSPNNEPPSANNNESPVIESPAIIGSSSDDKVVLDKSLDMAHTFVESVDSYSIHSTDEPNISSRNTDQRDTIETRDQPPEPPKPLKKTVSILRSGGSSSRPVIRKKKIPLYKTVSMNDAFLKKVWDKDNNSGGDDYSVSETYSVMSQQPIPIICDNNEGVEVHCDDDDDDDDEHLVHPRVSFASAF